jgi:two-component sensor histidine kinase/HAMP domain-containing protein
MIFLGAVCLILITIVHSTVIKQVIIQEEPQNIGNLSVEIAHHMNTHLQANTESTISFSSAPILRAALLESIAEYSVFSEEERNKEIDTLNKKWLETKEIGDPFIQEYLTNPIAEFLKFQQIILPGLYGEIFPTNKYGVMIASTEKLTTLAHAHKYWWESSFYEGKGRVFFDDRGFDESAKGYVLGIVVPIMNGNEIIGILKSNVNIDGLLTDVIQEFGFRHPGKIQIVRTKGLIIKEEGKIPLSSSLPDELIPYIQTMEVGTVIINTGIKTKFVAYSPIPLTVGSEKYGFGGSYESIDHIKGNEGEGWHIVITLDEDIVLISARRMTNLLIISVIIFTVFASFVALLLGKWFANPLIKLSAIAKKIGEGNLDTKVKVDSKDEIGILAQSINKMTDNLAKTLISRDKLIYEVEMRKEAEEKVNVQLQEKEIILKETHHRIKNNFISISSLLNLQADSNTNWETVSALKEAVGRINSMAVLYEKLLLTDDYQITSVKDYLDNLVNDIISLFPGNLKLTVTKQVADFQLDSKRMLPLGIIVNELLTNVMKYAFTGKSSGLIQITLKERNGDAILTILDDGNGLPEGFDLEEQKGFGLMLVDLYSQQLDGSFSIESNDGTKSVLEFTI